MITVDEIYKITNKFMQAKKALHKIAYAKNSDFYNWRDRGDKMQQWALKALKLMEEECGE